MTWKHSNKRLVGVRTKLNIIPDGDELLRRAVLGPLQVDDGSKLFWLEGGEAGGELGAPSATYRHPFEVVAGK